MATNYASFLDRVKKAATPQDVQALQKSLDRLYDAGEFSRLDLKMLRRETELRGQKR